LYASPPSPALPPTPGEPAIQRRLNRAKERHFLFFQFLYLQLTTPFLPHLRRLTPFLQMIMNCPSLTLVISPQTVAFT
jgi:hypothetical protein